MTKRTIIGLLALNVSLLGAQVMRPAEASAASSDAMLFDCCQASQSGVRFCCDQCCFLGENCDVNSDCASGGITINADAK